MKSQKFNLIITDLKSWAISTALFLGPIIAVSLVEFAMSQDFGKWTEPASLVLGSLLKLLQKYVQANTYKAN
jgi:hypothetical protein